MSRRFTLLAVAVSLCAPANCHAQATYARSIQNGEFGQNNRLRPDDPKLDALSKANWKVSADPVLPLLWQPDLSTPGGSIEYVWSGGWRDSQFLRLDGGGHVYTYYFGTPEPGKPYVASVRVRGKGKVWFGGREFGEHGQVGEAVFVERDVSTTKWTEYRGVYANKNPKTKVLHPFVAAQGPLDLDNVQLTPAEPADAETTREMSSMYGAGALIEDPDILAIRADESYWTRLAEFHGALDEFRKHRANVDGPLFESIEKKVADLEPYLSGDGKVSVLVACHNDMMALTRVMKRLSGADPGPPAPVAATAATRGAGYKPGERTARPDAVTVLDVRSDKVRYDENETATTVATLANTTSAPISGTMVAVAIAGLDDSREIARNAATLNVGETPWTFQYNVGPETYGRAIEVRFLDATGKTVDRWREYYAVAAEWFRVQQHAAAPPAKTYKTDPWATYFNQCHWYASEATDFGVHAADFEQYIAEHAGYYLNMPERKKQIKDYDQIGVKSTIYQSQWFGGNMGYEVIREHPEYALYDANGQFAVDRFYAGYPNPMEIASPIEIGPKRPPTKPYLDRKITPWGNGVVNTADPEVIEFEANAVKEYAKDMGVCGLYVDGNWGITSGFGYDGKPNVPSDDPAEYMKLGARNHRLFLDILKKDDPDFGIWYNWSYTHMEWCLAQGIKSYFGSGAKGDVGDENIRAAAGRNSMFLLEIQDTLRKPQGDSKWISPAYHLDMLADNRDHMIQRYGMNMVMGYIDPWPDSPDSPGANAWGWPTMNYFGAHLVSTQHHLAGSCFVPSMRPWLQFMTRYSRYLWSPDVKIVTEADRAVHVAAPDEVSWKRLVYKRITNEGYDLIVHLVRMPPTPKWDIEWLDEPKRLEKVAISLDIGQSNLRDAWAVRPYDFDEEQQTVEAILEAKGNTGTVTAEIPPFRYHTMVVFRIKDHT